MEILGGRERMGNGREQSEQEPSQAHGEPLLGKRVKRHVLLAQSAIEEMIELLGSLNDGRRMREEQALPDETTAAVPGLAHTMRKSWKTTVGLVMRGVTIDAIIPGGPADAAGSLRRFDQVLKVDGRDVNERTVMSEVMSTDTADTTVQLVVRRASSESRSPHNELGVQEVQVVLTRVPYASLGASLRTYETLERLRRNADFMSKFEKFQELPGEEPSWVLVEMLKLEFDAQHQRRHDLYKSQEKKLQDSANVIMRHMLLTKEVLAQLAQEHQDMLQFTQHAWLALQDRDKEEAQMEELLEKLVDQVNNNKMELEELHGINRASCMSCPELKVQIQRQEAELLKHFKSAFELKAAFDRAAHELNREADMQRERVAELEGKLRRVQAEADSCKQKLSANQGQLLDREQGSKQREGTQSAAESSVGTMMLLLADAVALGELLHHDLAHDAGSDAVNENTVLRDRVAALEAELSASQRFLHDVELLLQEETSAKMLLTDLQHEKNILEAHVEKRDHDIAELERQLHECRETLHLRDQSLIERQAQLETLTKRVEEAFETVEKLTGLEHVKNSLEAHVEKQDHDMAELERQLHDCRETLHLREAQLEALSDRVKEAFETVEKQGQAKESATQLNQELQLALDIKCGELDIKCGELDVAYYGEIEDGELRVEAKREGKQ
jgi:predicted  nucleic acid-binding Zn-ribbon protein